MGKIAAGAAVVVSATDINRCDGADEAFRFKLFGNQSHTKAHSTLLNASFFLPALSYLTYSGDGGEGRCINLLMAPK